MLTLYYWRTRLGRAEQIRLLLVELGLPWTEVDTEWGTPAWDALRPDPLAFGAQPAVVEPDGFALTQSGVILSYLARKHGYAPSDPRAAAIADALVWTAEDLRTAAARARRDEAKWAKFQASEWPRRWLGGLEHALAGAGTGFLVGPDPCHADLSWFDALEQLREVGLVAPPGSPVDRFFERIASRPRIAAWRASPERPPAES